MSKKRILAVDDNAVNLASLEKALQDEYEVIPMISGRRAIKFLMCEKVDLILLDVQMPAMDGLETLAEVRKTEHGVTVPVIFLTAMKDRNTVIEGSKLGIMDYVTKPFVADDLKARIEYVFNRVKGTPMDRETLLDNVKAALTYLSTGKTKQGIIKIESLLGYRLEDEIFNRLKSAMETLKQNNLESGSRKVQKVLQLLELSSDDEQLAITTRELYVKLLCARTYIENCKSRKALDECQDVLQRSLSPDLKERLQDVEQKILRYDDDEAVAALTQIIEDLGVSVTVNGSGGVDPRIYSAGK